MWRVQRLDQINAFKQANLFDFESLALKIRKKQIGLFKTVIRPHIVSEAEVSRLLCHYDVLPEHPARSPLRWAGTRLAIVLLYTAGLRRGEFIRLKLRDYDPCAQTLLIQTSKFHKSRLLPLPDDVAQEVERFLKARRAAYPSALNTEPLLRSPKILPVMAADRSGVEGYV